MWNYSVVNSIHTTSDKTRKCGHSLTKAATTSATTSTQVVEWYLRKIEGLYLEGLVFLLVKYAPLKSAIMVKPVWCFVIVRA